ncbi:MAG: hypothetical protein EBW27_04125 [Acidimicrobiia bacterium]|nr:hypothetical protein [Acidimicrobiia bacterium]
MQYFSRSISSSVLQLSDLLSALSTLTHRMKCFGNAQQETFAYRSFELAGNKSKKCELFHVCAMDLLKSSTIATALLVR